MNQENVYKTTAIISGICAAIILIEALCWFFPVLFDLPVLGFLLIALDYLAITLVVVPIAVICLTRNLAYIISEYRLTCSLERQAWIAPLLFLGLLAVKAVYVLARWDQVRYIVHMLTGMRI